MIPMQYVLRRRMMAQVNASGPFAFTYSGDFTDERVDGIGDVTLNTSGTLVTTGQTVTVTVYILAGGGGASVTPLISDKGFFASGGGGGYQTVEVELTPGTYEIVIGSGGIAVDDDAVGESGGDTIAFGIISTGGSGGITTAVYGYWQGGTGGTPNGGDGTGGSTSGTYAGGSPNGGAVVSGVSQAGGDGLVRITFS